MLCKSGTRDFTEKEKTYSPFNVCSSSSTKWRQYWLSWYMHIKVVVCLPAISKKYKKGSILSCQVLNF